MIITIILYYLRAAVIVTQLQSQSLKKRDYFIKFSACFYIFSCFKQIIESIDYIKIQLRFSESENITKDYKKSENLFIAEPFILFWRCFITLTKTPINNDPHCILMHHHQIQIKTCGRYFNRDNERRRVEFTRCLVT